MSTATGLETETTAPATPADSGSLPPPAVRSGPGHWLTDWRPEDLTFWNDGGDRIARRNLVLSIFTEHIGFSIWTLWSVFVLFMGKDYGFDASQKFMIVTLPAGVGAVLRLPYSYAVARFGGRNWTVFSAAILLIPATLAAIVLKPGVSYSTVLIVAATAGVGGGNFASSMTNINAFYPQRLKGRALGLNAGGGNLGVAGVQLIGLLVLATAGRDHPRLILAFYLPLIVIGAVAAALVMDNIAGLKNDRRALRDVAKETHTWVISFLYIGTFGSFIGFGFAFGQVLQVQFKADFSTPVKAAYLTFLGPLLGSLIRPLGGILADRVGGARVTFWNFVCMAAAATLVLVASLNNSLPLFVTGFLLLFVFSGIGNGSVYKMIPAIFGAKMGLAVAKGADPAAAELKARRLAGALIGLAGAIGAFGGVLVNIAFRQSFLTGKTGDPAYIAFLAFYAACVLLTWFVYLRPSKSKLANI